MAGSLLILGIFLPSAECKSHGFFSESDVEITVFQGRPDEANIQNIGQQLVLMPNVAEVKYGVKKKP